MKKEIGFIGGGRIVRIILSALKKNGFDLSAVAVFDSDVTAGEKAKAEFTEIRLVNSVEDVCEAAIVFIAVHPPVFADVLAMIKDKISASTGIVSFAPKIRIEKIETLLGRSGNIARMIPNAPSILGKGYNPVAFSEQFNSSLRESLNEIFSALGQFPEVAEDKLEGYAVLAAMGPTYFFYQIYEIMEIAQNFSLTNDEIRAAMQRMLEGTFSTVFDSNLSSVEVMDLIPGKPMSSNEDVIKNMYREALNTVYAKIKP